MIRAVTFALCLLAGVAQAESLGHVYDVVPLTTDPTQAWVIAYGADDGAIVPITNAWVIAQTLDSGTVIGACSDPMFGTGVPVQYRACVLKGLVVPVNVCAYVATLAGWVMPAGCVLYEPVGSCELRGAYVGRGSGAQCCSGRVTRRGVCR